MEVYRSSAALSTPPRPSRLAIRMSEISHLAAEAASRIFRDLGDPQALNSARDEGRRASLWHALEEAGLTRAWVPEALGGADASLADGFEVLRVAGSFAPPCRSPRPCSRAGCSRKPGSRCPGDR